MYDDAGGLTNRMAPGSFADAREYDVDDRLIRRALTALVADTMTLDAQGRMTAVRSGYPFNYVSAVYYNGLGAVIAADNLAEQSSREDFRVDGIGNRQFAARRASRSSGHADYDRMRLHTYDSGGRLTRTVDSLTYPLLSTQYDFVREQTFDAASNVQWRGEHEHDYISGEWYDHLMSYYGADEKLALANRHIGIGAVSDDSRAGARGVWEMYRYDALGRHVQTHSVRGSACASTETECASYFERTVWDGDQVLYEIRTPESLPWTDNPGSGAYHAFGRVLYLHGGGLDAPLAITRMDLSGQPAEVTVAPHADWQGHFVGGSLMSGASQAPCTGASGCPLIDWPGGKMTTDGLLPTPLMRAWWGRFLQGQVDGSGLRYQRNRFYDPLTGQFTQQDPIGLAGGINLYAFAGGDPVNFMGPFGLFDIEVQGENSKKIVAYLLANSATFRDAYNRLDSDRSVRLTIRDAIDPLRAGVGYNAFRLGDDGRSGTIIFNDVGLNQANSALLSVDPKSPWMFTAASIMGHEMGHANAALGNGPVACRHDNPPGCILRFENQVRRELPANARGGVRSRYDLDPRRP